MLPGFRFLLAAILLSMSTLIFGLGAAALLRAAHQEFAGIPSRRAPPETMFAQREAGPALAMLRAEPSEAHEKPENPTTPDNVPIAAPFPEQTAIASTAPDPEKRSAEPDGIAALTDAATPAENPLPPEALKPGASTSEIPVQAEMPAQADAPSPAIETKLAAIAEVTAAPDQVPVTAPDQAATPIDDTTRIAEAGIATLSGSPVTIEPRTSSKRAPPVVKKPVQARHVVKRRRIVQRARVARPAPQRPANPFGTPFGS
ncbi:MAG: hypothetical protein QOJ84_2326 [Bradyrhizobium sp.]|jgi:hypothetical protein|nr:hypothetical protein [Bradyrhizobium sp.]